MIEQQFGIEILPTWHDRPTGDAHAYTRDVRAELAKILQSRTGKYLAAALLFQKTQSTKPPILVMPYEGNDCNAEEDSVTRGSAQSVVLFSPATRASRCSDGKAATLPHEILFHELVHSLRRVSGHLHRHSVISKLQPYTNTEEFLAILVTNIFISDVTNHHKTALRANHESHTALDPEIADSFRYFSLGTRAFNVIANFCSDNRGFTRMLATVPARFNPIAAYYSNPHKAFEMAANGDAENVFEGMTPLDYARDGKVWKRIIPYAGPGPKA